MIKVKNLSGGYDRAFHLENINFQVNKGEFFGIIGPNGSGKTTLVKMISGILPYEKGTVVLNKRDMINYRPKQLAQMLAVLPQLTEQSFRFTVRETVALGRYAHQTGLFTTLTKDDEATIDEVMVHTHISKYAHVTIDQLSGGERQRVFLAQALAQEPEVIILDEPTNHLDLAYQKELLDLLNEWTVERELTIVAIFHDLNLASLYCDRLLLLHHGHVHICDEPNEVVQRKHILKVYQTDVETRAHPAVPKSQVMLTPRESESNKRLYLDKNQLTVTDDLLIFESPVALKTVSTNSLNNGNGWYKQFINYYFDSAYLTENQASNEIADLLAKKDYQHQDSVVMLTAANLHKQGIKQIELDEFSLFIVVTASTNNPSQDSCQEIDNVGEIGPINIWVFIEGKLSDYTFIQSIVTATEAKTRALQYMNVGEPGTDIKTIGSPAGNILIAATQSGQLCEVATPESLIGKQISKAVFDCMVELFQKNNK